MSRAAICIASSLAIGKSGERSVRRPSGFSAPNSSATDANPVFSRLGSIEIRLHQRAQRIEVGGDIVGERRQVVVEADGEVLGSSRVSFTLGSPVNHDGC